MVGIKTDEHTLSSKHWQLAIDFLFATDYTPACRSGTQAGINTDEIALDTDDRLPTTAYQLLTTDYHMSTFSSFAELAAFLMVYVARADGQAHYLEEATLIEQLKNFSPHSEKLLLEATRNYLDNKDEKIEDILKANETLLHDASGNERQELIKSLFAIVNSDGRVQTEETSALRVIRAAVEGAL